MLLTIFFDAISAEQTAYWIGTLANEYIFFSLSISIGSCIFNIDFQ